jgi:hypothetical protein
MRTRRLRAPKGFKMVFECDICHATMPLKDIRRHPKFPVYTIPNGYVCKEDGCVHIFLLTEEISQRDHGNICGALTKYPERTTVVTNPQDLQYIREIGTSREIREKLEKERFKAMSYEEAQKFYRSLREGNKRILSSYGIDELVVTLPPE